MRVGFIGIGVMGEPMAGHILASGDHPLTVYDRGAQAVERLVARGARAATSAAEVARQSDVLIIMVGTDAQVRDVASEARGGLQPGSVVVIASTVNPHTVLDLAPDLADGGTRLVDAPVVYGLSGARSGQLVSLAGGAAEDLRVVEPVIATYSRKVYHVGPLGSGEVAKTVNNMLHWAAALANYEALLLGKALGLDAALLREILLDCPGRNGTLERFEASRFTWSEKDMDIAMDLAQERELMLPFYGLVDQLIRPFSAAIVQELLHQPTSRYLGRAVVPVPLRSEPQGRQP